jgi:hypothetical protein
MSRSKFALIAAAAALPLVACSSPHKSATPPVSRPPAVSAPTTTTAPASAAAAASTSATTATELAGKWSGTYGGAYQGTFILSWRQSGSKLSGTITISAPAGTLAIHGTVVGGAIRFGTVGSLAITYSGTVSGNSMSGTYQVKAASGAAGGPWQAAKTS